MKRTIARVLMLSGASASIACGVIIGLDERSARKPVVNDGSFDDASNPDAGPTLDAGGSFCADAGGALFCDDFDLPGQTLSARWSGSELLQLSSPIITLDGGVSLVHPDASASPPAAFEATLLDTESGGLTTAGLLQEFDGKLAKDGFVLSFSVQVAEFEAADASNYKDVGPNPDLYNQAGVGIGGFFSFADFQRYGFALAITASNIIMSEGLEGNINDNYASAARIKLLTIGQQGWTKVTVVTGPRDNAIAYASARAKLPVCPAGPLVTIAFASLTLEEPGCILADAVRSPVASGMPFVLLLGVSASDPARARFRFDNVLMERLP